MYRTAGAFVCVVLMTTMTIDAATVGRSVKGSEPLGNRLNQVCQCQVILSSSSLFSRYSFQVRPGFVVMRT